MLGVWGEQRVRNCIDASQTINSDQNPSEIAAVALALQTGLIAVVDVQSTLTDLNSLRLALRAREDFLAANNSADAKHKNTFSAQKVAQNKKSPLDNAPPVPPPQILPEIARIVVALPPAPTEEVTAAIRRDLVLSGAGGNRGRAQCRCDESLCWCARARRSRGDARALCSPTTAASLCISATPRRRPPTPRRGRSLSTATTVSPACRCLAELPPLPRGRDRRSVGQGRAGALRVRAPERDAGVRRTKHRSEAARSRELAQSTFHAKNQPNRRRRASKQPVWVTDIGLHHADERVATVSGVLRSAHLRSALAASRDFRHQVSRGWRAQVGRGGARRSDVRDFGQQGLCVAVVCASAEGAGWPEAWRRALSWRRRTTPTKPLVATTGLDRFVHVYDRGPIVDVCSGFYLKQRMTGVYMSHDDEPVALPSCRWRIRRSSASGAQSDWQATQTLNGMQWMTTKMMRRMMCGLKWQRCTRR
jgi:hypothetical protein